MGATSGPVGGPGGATEDPGSERLAPYRAKRSLDRTPEPGGGRPHPGGSRYVFHKHAARNLHWDLRLELDGVLLSWAVPKGPSYDTAEKRLAVHVEDHPVEYGDFEGRIPEGNYGAGAVIIWDAGTWVPIGDPAEGLASGKLLFELRGHKLRGLWTLVKIRKTEREWLLIKERDELAASADSPRVVPEQSVMSGLLVEELKAGFDPVPPVLGRLEELGAPPLTPGAPPPRPMLAERAEKPFTRDGWVFEPKLDGYRILALREGSVTRLLTRNGRDATAAFPEVARAVDALPYPDLVLDGEVVALDEAGRPSFQHLQRRAQYLRPHDAARSNAVSPVRYYVFDLLTLADRDLRPLPLLSRKEILRRVLPPVGPLVGVDHFDREGERVFREVERLGLEGLVAKRADAPYREGRSPAWLKIRKERTGDFVVVGYTEPKGSRPGFGGLHLATHEGEGGALVYCGSVGSGFADEDLTAIRANLDTLRQETTPCREPLPDGVKGTWIRPLLVCEVRYVEWTDQGLLRQPVFLRWRDDKGPEECIRHLPEPGSEEPPIPEPAPSVPHEVHLSNLDKIFWPDEGYAKRDLIEYYEAIAPWMLVYLRDRPVVLTRYPDGITGPSFFQKDAPEYAPDWLRRETMWSEHAEREIRYFIADDVPSLRYIANMAAIPLHIWASRVGHLEHPDWCVLDLDPKEAPFSSVVAVARAVRELCEEVGLPSFVKTTGSTGLHVLLPLGRALTHEQSRNLGELLARVVVGTCPDLATVARVIDRREGKVYVDYLQNGHGKLMVSPFSVRPVPGAMVSMPLRWEEVGPDLDLRDHTIRNAVTRMERMGGDPMAEVLTAVPDLPNVLARLATRR